MWLFSRGTSCAILEQRPAETYRFAQYDEKKTFHLCAVVIEPHPHKSKTKGTGLGLLTVVAQGKEKPGSVNEVQSHKLIEAGKVL